MAQWPQIVSMPNVYKRILKVWTDCQRSPDHLYITHAGYIFPRNIYITLCSLFFSPISQLNYELVTQQCLFVLIWMWYWVNFVGKTWIERITKAKLHAKGLKMIYQYSEPDFIPSDSCWTIRSDNWYMWSGRLGVGHRTREGVDTKDQTPETCK